MVRHASRGRGDRELEKYLDVGTNVCRNGARHSQTGNLSSLILDYNATERCAMVRMHAIPGTLGIVSALHAIVAGASGLEWKSQFMDV